MLNDFNAAQLIADFITPERISLAVRVILILLIGIPLVRLIRNVVRRLIKDRLSAQSEQLLVRAVYYISSLILLISVLNEFGFKLSALLGAAGVFGIAIGFASQTSISNIISGIFLISEKPFMVGDAVQIGTTVGVIESIDLLSIKLKTFDNRFVRVPNETMIKTEVINITRYPVRRANLSISVSYKEDLRHVLAILSEIAASEPLAISDPEPWLQVDSFGDSGININFGVWASKDNVVVLKTALMLSIKERFDKENIEIPYPHLTLVANEVTQS
ncbi:MAG: mechanosensitive ion channel family protein [Candidatus Cloacimonas sp.]|jgi:small-conductance mechanosensitive channel|nr:mechanosensitive ion channel family protein [Candidatus Cloacimonas sp.]